MAMDNYIVSVACPKGNHFFQNFASPDFYLGSKKLSFHTLAIVISIQCPPWLRFELCPMNFMISIHKHLVKFVANFLDFVFFCHSRNIIMLSFT